MCRGRRLQPVWHRLWSLQSSEDTAHLEWMCAGALRVPLAHHPCFSALPGCPCRWYPVGSFAVWLPGRLNDRKWEQGEERKPGHPFLHPSCSGTPSPVISRFCHLHLGSSVPGTLGSRNTIPPLSFRSPGGDRVSPSYMGPHLPIPPRVVPSLKYFH